MLHKLLAWMFLLRPPPVQVQNGEIVDHAFEFEREFHIKSSREFIEYCQNEALLVQVCWRREADRLLLLVMNPSLRCLLSGGPPPSLQLWGCPPESNQYKFPILTANLKTPPLEKCMDILSLSLSLCVCVCVCFSLGSSVLAMVLLLFQ